MSEKRKVYRLKKPITGKSVPPKNSKAASGPRVHRRTIHAAANTATAASGKKYCHPTRVSTCQRG